MSPEPIDTPEPEQPEQPASLAEFREAFPAEPKPGQPPPEPAGEKGPKRRAQSHVAKSDDVPEIAALTKQLREAEDAIQIERKAGESDRVFQLRKRAEIARRAAQPALVAAAAPVREEPRRAPVAESGAFTEKEPTIEQFAAEADPYTAWQRALGRYDRKKEAHEATVAARTTEYQQQEAAFNRDINAGVAAHAQRVQAYANQPEVKALFDAEFAKHAHEQIPLTLAMRGAIEFHERGPEMIVALLKDPSLADDLFLLTRTAVVGDPRTDSTVATVRRRLLQRLSGASSGSPAPSRPQKLAPRPPNPERTVPQTPRDTSPTDAPGSLAEHRRQFPTRH